MGMDFILILKMIDLLNLKAKDIYFLPQEFIQEKRLALMF